MAVSTLLNAWFTRVKMIKSDAGCKGIRQIGACMFS